MSMRMALRAGLVFSVLLALPGSARGDTEEHEHKASGFHHVGLFLGGTTKEVHHETETTFTLGAEYSYRLNPWFGLVAMAEFAGEEFRSHVFVAGVTIYPIGRLGFAFTAGVEHVDKESLFLVRTGVGWGISLGGPWLIVPELFLDVGQETAVVYGLAFGRAFGE